MRTIPVSLVLAAIISGCTVADRHVDAKIWPTVPEASAIAAFGKAKHWTDDKARLYCPLWQCPKEIIAIDPLDVVVSDSAVIVTIQDDDDMWRALVIPYAAYAAPKEWVVVGTESGVLRVQMAIKSQGDRKPRFSKDCFIAGGRLSLGGQDGRVFGSGTDAYQGELTPGRHSFLLTWRTKDEQFRLSVTRWLECDVSKGHYRLTVKRIGDSISFLALVGARREVVAISPPAQLQKEPIIPDDGEIISVEELQGLL